MFSKKTSLLIVLFICFVIQTKAQWAKEEALASQYYEQQEFEKAADIYEKLYDKTQSENFYNLYIDCLLALNDFKTAEKAVKKQIKKDKEHLEYIVQLGFVYKKGGDQTKATKEFERAIDMLSSFPFKAQELSNAFLSQQEPDYAIKSYLRARNITNSNYTYNFELAELYNNKGNYAQMINEYLDLLSVDPSQLTRIQNALQTNFNDENGKKKTQLLKSQLLKKIQESPDEIIFSEMLIWLYVQERDFESAFTQSKALDKRQKQDGTKLINLANICIQNQNYDIAVKCYEYVILKGNTNYYYTEAKMGLLETLKTKITGNYTYTQADLLQLEKSYTETINELGKSATTINLVRSLAHLKAFYLHNIPDAITLLEDAIAITRLNSKIIAECKLELGDILLLSGEMWECSLLYSQVEKAFHEDALGQEAKLRNARLSFYKGDFKWAQAQLDVLKASTSKLIANDALALSLLITDNTGLDSITEPLRYYANADLLMFQNKDSLAMITLDSIANQYPAHSINDDVLFKKYQLMLKKGNFTNAATYLEKIIERFPEDVLGDDAMFYLAELNEVRFKNLDKAKELYQKLLTDYPGSLYNVDARKRFRILRGDVVN